MAKSAQVYNLQEVCSDDLWALKEANMLRVIRTTTDSGLIVSQPIIRFYENVHGDLTQDVLVKYTDMFSEIHESYYTSLGNINFKDALDVLGFKRCFVPRLNDQELSPFRAAYYQAGGGSHELVFSRSKKAHFLIVERSRDNNLIIALTNQLCREVLLCPSIVKRKPYCHGRFGIIKMKPGDYAKIGNSWIGFSGSGELMLDERMRQCDDLLETKEKSLVDCTSMLNMATIVSTNVTLL